MKSKSYQGTSKTSNEVASMSVVQSDAIVKPKGDEAKPNLKIEERAEKVKKWIERPVK